MDRIGTEGHVVVEASRGSILEYEVDRGPDSHSYRWPSLRSLAGGRVDLP
jgi:hypothetical protein